MRVGPFHLSDTALAADLDKAIQAAKKDGSAIFGVALSAGATAGRILTGALITLFATIFMLIDGAGVRGWIVGLFPRPARTAVDGAGRSGWLTLSAFVRIQLLVAAADAVGVGLVAFFLGLPVVVPLAVLVLLASFVPLVGAIATGVLAVLIALVYLGPFEAMIMLAGVLVVHLMESHVLQPLVMGSAVRVHRLAVVLAVAGGSFLAGIPGRPLRRPRGRSHPHHDQLRRLRRLARIKPGSPPTGSPPPGRRPINRSGFPVVGLVVL